MKATGSEQLVFDWSTEACETWDIPDQPARAFKDYRGNVQLLASHAYTRAAVGSDLNTVRHGCAVVNYSHFDPDPSHYDDLVWLSAPYTLDGRTIYGVQHMEYRGWEHNTCTPPSSDFGGLARCWYNALTLTTSTDGGLTYHQAPSPDQLVASVPDTFAEMAGNGEHGVFTPSNIVLRPSDGYYYMMARTTDAPRGEIGTCVMRTRNLSDPRSWRAWDGSGFNMRFIDPYIETSEPREPHVCKHVAITDIGSMSESLTYNTYFGKYMLVGLATPTNPSTGETVPGFFYSLSDDLLHWSRWKILMHASVPSLPNCGDPDPVRDPAVLDPTSTSRNFETVGKHAYLYFERLHVTYTSTFCYWPEDRDLVRIPIEFSGADQPQSPPAPAPGPSPPASPSPAPAAPAGTGTLSTRCLSARRDRARLLKLVQSTRRKLANARTKSAKARYRRLLKVRKRQLARARSAAAVAC